MNELNITPQPCFDILTFCNCNNTEETCKKSTKYDLHFDKYDALRNLIVHLFRSDSYWTTATASFQQNDFILKMGNYIY